MTTKELSATEKVSISRMNEIVHELGLQSPADYVWDISPAKRGRRMFTSFAFGNSGGTSDFRAFECLFRMVVSFIRAV